MDKGNKKVTKNKNKNTTDKFINMHKNIIP